MIQLIVGNKGSGKTKRLIDMVNTAVKESKGNVICVEKGLQLTFDLSYHVRLVDIESYNIKGFDALYGFLCGMLAGNYDITDLFVDATLKIGGRDLTAFADMIEKLKAVTGENVTLTFTVSCDQSELPEHIKAFMI